MELHPIQLAAGAVMSAVSPGELWGEGKPQRVSVNPRRPDSGGREPWTVLLGMQMEHLD